MLKEENAKILELEIIDEVAKQYKEETGKTLEVRVCVAGPTDLYLQAFGTTAFADAYHILALDIENFIKQAFKTAKNFKIKVVALDEPSLGINDRIQLSDADIDLCSYPCFHLCPETGSRYGDSPSLSLEV